MNGPIFLDSYVKGPIFLTSWYMHIFFAQRFFEAAYPLCITCIDYHIYVITSKTWVQKIKGQYMNRSTFWMIKYMNGSVFSKARYMNRVGFEILARTPVPKLPLCYLPPTPRPAPPPPPPTEVPSARVWDRPGRCRKCDCQLVCRGCWRSGKRRKPTLWCLIWVCALCLGLSV